MKTVYDRFIVQIDTEYSKYARNEQGEIILGANGHPIATPFSNDFNYAENQSRVARVISAPVSFTNDKYKKWSFINDGDSILLHKEAFAKEHQLENTDGYYLLMPDFIIAKVDSEDLVPCGDRVFLNIIENEVKEKIGLIYVPEIAQEAVVKQCGIVKWASPSAIEWGISNGDTAFMNEVAQAKVKFNGVEYYTVDKEMLLGKKVGEDLFPYGYYITVEPYPEPETIIFVGVKSRTNTLKGYVKGVGVACNHIQPNEDILYFRIKYAEFGELLIMREEHAIGTVKNK